MFADSLELESFLRYIAYEEGIVSSFIWWNKLRHRYPFHKWDGDSLKERKENG